uniref:Myb-like domain-containing protein n=2 Tax=Peronospora matthiolae TaxID=2874970 RepID=A0AAV1TAY9_9STRA
MATNRSILILLSTYLPMATDVCHRPFAAVTTWLQPVSCNAVTCEKKTPPRTVARRRLAHYQSVSHTRDQETEVMMPGQKPPRASAVGVQRQWATEGSACAGALYDKSDTWLQEEHGRFMQALELYGSRQDGDEWMHITDFVGSRTLAEVRLHGRQYLQQLVRQLPPSPSLTRHSLATTGRPQDSSRLTGEARRSVDLHKVRGDSRKRGMLQPEVSGGSALSAAALECAQALTGQTLGQARSQPLQLLEQSNQPRIAGLRRNGLKTSTAWTFKEDKTFEVALAGWAGSEAYPWTEIAATVPGKTVKEVRHHFDEMAHEVDSSETPGNENSAVSDRVVVHQQGRSSLSQRTVPPPPIEVPPRSSGKDATLEIFRSGTGSRTRRGSASSIGMLSPTFIDMLANGAESDEKVLLPALPFSTLPSPLFSPTLLPLGSPNFFSPGHKKSMIRSQHDKKLSIADRSSDVDMTTADVEMTAMVTTTHEDPRHFSTPRIWNDFLADVFKFDESLGFTPLHGRRRTPRFKTPPSFDKRLTGTDEQDVEMTDASTSST